MRLFFAFWPSAEKAQEMAVWVRAAHALYGGRMMQTDTLHMTLAFLGSAQPARARALADACRGWRLPSGSMVLRAPGRFRRAKVVWLGPETPEQDALSWLFQAHEQLWSHLVPLGWMPDESPFRPHVSLLRRAETGALDALHGPPVLWTPERCVLVASEPTATRSRYTVLADVSLETSAPP